LRLVLLVTSPRVAPGTLTWEAWQALREGVVFTRDQEHPQRVPLAAAGISTEALDPQHSPAAVARILRAAAEQRGTAVWLASAGGDDDIGRALADMTLGQPSADPVEIEVMHGSWDVPGSRLLDVVTTMDRLRSPGGCPWDAQQTHDSLAPYLLEEAYEAFQAIEDDDPDSLREELGDVLLQVAFHARLAEERDAEDRWTIDDVAAGLVDKLVRRHPHVFGDVHVQGAEDVVANWDAIKAAEKGRASAVDGVAMSAPALTLAVTLQRKAAKLGVPSDLLAPEVSSAQSAAAAVAALAAAYDDEPGPDTAGALLWSVVAALRAHDVDGETALRARARTFRDRLATVEREVHGSDEDVRGLDHAEWRDRWDAADPS
jgi:XTP/dITP diphosphohydrolase